MYLVVPFCSIFIIIGAWIMIASGHKILLGVKAASWQQTVGYLSSVVSDYGSPDVPGREIRVRYSYAVAEHEYQGNTIHPSYGSACPESAHRDLESLLQPAEKISVYYDPADPGQSMLSPGFYSCSLTVLFGGFIFLAAGVGFLLAIGFAMAGNQDFALGITVIE